MNQQETINNFFREYVDRSFKTCKDHIKPSEQHTKEHFLRICEVCFVLKKLNIPFFTEVRLKCGLIPDIVTPTHILKIIEVMSSEDYTKFMEKKFPKIPEALKNEYALINANVPFKEEMIM